MSRDKGYATSSMRLFGNVQKMVTIRNVQKMVPSSSRSMNDAKDKSLGDIGSKLFSGDGASQTQRTARGSENWGGGDASHMS